MAYSIVYSSTGVHAPDRRSEVLIESAADLPTLPAELAPGSIAYTASLAKMWQKDVNGSWVQIAG